MTVQDLYDKVLSLQDEEFAALDEATKRNYLERRAAILSGTRDLWDKASIPASVDPNTGLISYVSKAKAVQYGRLKLLNDLLTEEAKKAAIVDITNLEAAGVKLYTTGFDGYAWAYSQGYALPITGGAKVPLIAQAVYSDFYGAAFDATVKKNLAAWPDDILATVTRALNQGKPYSAIAKDIVGSTDTAYFKALRVASTEGGRIQSQAYLDSLALLDEVGAEYGKMWISTIDDHTRESHIAMDGEMADEDGNFHLTDPEDVMQAPRMGREAAQNIGCRCSSGTIINGEKPTERRVGKDIIPYETYRQRLDRGGDIPIKMVRQARK
jgi:hypothetical protein